MSTIDDAKWEKLHEYHNNWIPGVAVMYGLLWRGDPGYFTHRALVFLEEDEWHLRSWGNMQPNIYGEWIDCGVYKTKRTAMRQARTMAKLFESLREEEKDDE